MNNMRQQSSPTLQFGVGSTCLGPSGGIPA
jgi:hypothetical protein